MNTETIVGICIRLFPELDDIHGVVWLQKEIDICIQKTAVHLLATGVTSGPDYEAFLEVVKGSHLPLLDHVRECRAQAHEMARVDALRASIRSKRHRARRFGQEVTLTPEEAAQEALDS